MSIVRTLKSVRETVEAYKWNAYTAPTEASTEVLLAQKKQATQLRDLYLGFQKQAGKDRDIDAARFFRGEAAEQMKLYRAATFLLPWYVSIPPGDCREVAPSDWPVELAAQLDYLTGLAEAA